MVSFVAFSRAAVLGCVVLAACDSGSQHSASNGAGGSSAHVVSSATGNGGNSGTAGAGGTGSGGGDGGCLGDGLPDGGAAPIVCEGSGSRFVTSVVEACIGPAGGFGLQGFPSIVFGPPKGGGTMAGSFDVLGLGEGGSIVVAFAGNAIVDGPGPDFIVFENAFDVGGDPTKPYANPGTVAVSDDGISWTSFPCTATGYPYGSCAGWHPVLANADANTIDPLDPSTAGGDAFDLADIGVTQARYVRITDRADLPGDFDLDAVSIVNALCP